MEGHLPQGGTLLSMLWGAWRPIFLDSQKDREEVGQKKRENHRGKKEVQRLRTGDGGQEQ